MTKQYEKAMEIMVYTRDPEKDYTESLSNSIHLACKKGEEKFQPLNRNYGILFAKATINEDNVIKEKGLKNPYLFQRAEGSFGILAIRVTGQGEADPESRGHVLFWQSNDLTDFGEEQLLELHKEEHVEEVQCRYLPGEKIYELRWKDSKGKFYRNTLTDLSESGSISEPEEIKEYERISPEAFQSGVNPGNSMEIDWETGNHISSRWSPLQHTEIKVPDCLKANTLEEVREIKAAAVYSDGSLTEKQVDWDCGNIDFSVPGTYELTGKVLRKEYPFPLARGYADPVILPWNGKYYYVATNDNKNDIGIFVREAENVEGLFAAGYKEVLILDENEEKNFVQTFWAPEFHCIGEELYILFAVSGKQWGPQCHMMKLKKGGDILHAEDWEEPVRVRRADGSYLAEEGITLDMTYFNAGGSACVLWSFRKGIGTPLDTGSMIYIASIDEKNPTVLTSEPVLLTRPLYGWENIQGTINNEGPYPLVTEDMVYITYSGGAACGYTYALGLLSIPVGSDYLDATAWKKATTPVLSYYSIEGVYGPGHNSFFRDYDGSVWILYHGETELVPFGKRCTAMHRVHFDRNGSPVFDLAGERDLSKDLEEISLKIIVE